MRIEIRSLDKEILIQKINSNVKMKTKMKKWRSEFAKNRNEEANVSPQ